MTTPSNKNKPTPPDGPVLILNKEQHIEIRALSRTLYETAGQLERIVRRKHPALDDVTWLIERTLDKLKAVASVLQIDL